MPECYSSMCGRILGYGWGHAFNEQIKHKRTIDVAYMTGVSLTHGLPGQTRHIWSLAATGSEQFLSYKTYICPCTNINVTWEYEVPKFMGNDFFCDTNSRIAVLADGIWTPVREWPDTLWDGNGCGPTSLC